jgi:hypothetical protein
MIKSTVLGLALVAFACGGAFAAGGKSYSLSNDNRVTSVKQSSSHYVAPMLAPRKKDVIFSNIGSKYPKGLYFCCYGDTISGPSSPVGGPYSVALQFTPAEDAKMTEIDAGVGWVSGANAVTISLYEDDGGQPGALISSAQASGLGTFGDCCTMATAPIKAKLTGGTPYWVGVSADGATWAAWAFNSTDQIDSLNAAYSSGSGWTAGGALPAPAFQVIGK